MITNRPRPPRRLYSGTSYDSNAYTFFSSEETGLTVYDMATAGEFVNVFSEKSVAGNLHYLVAACDNNSGSAVEFGLRLMIDENTVWNYRTISCAATSEAGFSLAGYWMWDTSEPFCQCADRHMIFTQSISLDAYAETLTSVDVLVAYKYKIANRVGV